MPSTVPMPLVHALVRTVGYAEGVPRESLLREAGLLQRFDERDRVELAELARLQESAQRLTGNAALGLQMCGQAGHHFDVVGHMMGHADTLRDAIELAGQYGHMVFEDYHLKLRVRPTLATIRFEFARCSPGADRMLADFVMAGMLRLIRLYVGPQAVISRVSFEYEQPRDVAAYQNLFGCPVAFAQATTALEFPAAHLTATSTSRNPELLSLLREHADKALARRIDRSRELNAAAVSRYLRACTPSRLPTMSETARDLGMSTRSLRRRLAEDGVSYRELAQSALEEAALHMVRQASRPLEEVARRLGFTDVTSFQRAFKRWTGCTPRQFQSLTPEDRGTDLCRSVDTRTAR